MSTTKRKVELWVHTTSGVEFEIRDADTGEVIAERWFVADEGDSDAEDAEREWVAKRCAKLGFELEEVWS